MAETHKPLNDRQRRFAELVVQGRPAGRAYEEAGYDARGDVAEAAASRLLTDVKVASYVEELRQHARDSAKMTLEELQQFLADAIRTPVGEINETSPLCQERQFVTGNGDKADTIKIKSVDKLRAAHLMIGVMGWNKPVKVEGNITLSRVLAEINESPLASS